MAESKQRVVLVTGASRGAGKGIALALGGCGDIVYVTGRTRVEGDAALPGTVYATAEEINRRGGTGIAVVCDHSDDAQVKALFEQIEREQGRLDILVNNALALPDSITQPGPFWEKPLDMIDITDVGMRSSYVASWYAAPLLIQSEHGLVVNTSSFGGRCYMHGPAYGAGKAAVDKMAHDMAIDFEPHDVCVVSIWMGLLLTERTQRVFDAQPELYAHMAETAETPEFSGLLIDALSRDPQRMARSGLVLVGAELGAEYGVVDVNGKQPPSHRSMLGDVTEFNPAVIH
ncbi:MAG: SDR family NAD(P)-dependent oxidoreductase [Pseudomonadales bacterium]